MSHAVVCRRPESARSRLPYSRHWVSDADIEAVVEVLRSDWLTTGPMVDRFERAVAQYVGVAHAVATSSGTAALHAAMFALGVGPGDEVIVPAMSFVATANCVVYQGGRPVFADVDPGTLLVAPSSVERLIGRRTRAIVAVDYAGQPCDYPALRQLADRHGLALVADSCHALGGAAGGARVGRLADLSTFSFHAVKPITTGEGGLVATDSEPLGERVRRFRNHGIDRDHRQRWQLGSWHYDVTDLGYNYRMTDVQAALGLSQLRRLDDWQRRREALAALYDALLSEIPGIRPLEVRPGVRHARHLYVVRVKADRLGMDRGALYAALRRRGIQAAVHYPPIHLHSFYRRHFHTGPGMCPAAEAAYQEILSLPLFPAMGDEDVIWVVESIRAAVREGR